MIRQIINYFKTKGLNIIISDTKNYNAFAVNLLLLEITKRLNRRECDIIFGDHAANDKNLDKIDSENVIYTVRHGKIDEYASTEEKERICFKNYFSERGITYFVIVKYSSEFIKIITVIKKKGKY